MVWRRLPPLALRRPTPSKYPSWPAGPRPKVPERKRKLQKTVSYTSLFLLLLHWIPHAERAERRAPHGLLETTHHGAGRHVVVRIAELSSVRIQFARPTSRLNRRRRGRSVRRRRPGIRRRGRRVSR